MGSCVTAGMGRQRTVLSRTIARVIGETWKQAPIGADVPHSLD